MNYTSSYHEAVHCLVFKLIWGLYLTIPVGSLHGQELTRGLKRWVVCVLWDGTSAGLCVHSTAASGFILLYLSSQFSSLVDFPFFLYQHAPPSGCIPLEQEHIVRTCLSWLFSIRCNWRVTLGKYSVSALPCQHRPPLGQFVPRALF